MDRKRRSNHNALTHGIFAQIFLKGNPLGEDRKDFFSLVSMLRSSIRPVSTIEEAFVEKLGVLFFRLARLYRADLDMAPRIFARVVEDLASGKPPVEAQWISFRDQVLVVGKNPSTDSIIRYEANLERQIARTLGQIQTLRQMPGIDPTPALRAAEEE